MVTVLSTLANLRDLHLGGFRCPRSRVDREHRLQPRLTRVVLPALTSFEFKGDSEYMLDIVGQIDMPLLDRLNMTLFNQLTFDTPHFRDFSGRIETFETPRKAEIYISGFGVEVKLFRRDGRVYRPTLSLVNRCRQLDRQLSSLAQLFNLGLFHILTLERLAIDGSRGHWKDETDNAQWLEVLHPFTSVMSHVLGWGLLDVVAPALEDLAGESVTEVLPALNNLFLQFQQPSEPVKKAIGKFISARRLSGRPITVRHKTPLDQAYELWEVSDQ